MGLETSIINHLQNHHSYGLYRPSPNGRFIRFWLDFPMFSHGFWITKPWQLAAGCQRRHPSGDESTDQVSSPGRCVLVSAGQQGMCIPCIHEITRMYLRYNTYCLCICIYIYMQYCTVPADSKCPFIIFYFCLVGKEATLPGKRRLLMLPGVFTPAPAILVCWMFLIFSSRRNCFNSGVIARLPP